MQFIETQRHKRKLIYNGLHVHTSQTACRRRMGMCKECVKRRGSKNDPGDCKAQLKLSSVDTLVEEKNDHSHAPSKTQCEVDTVKASIKDTNDTTQQVLAGEMEYQRLLQQIFLS